MDNKRLLQVNTHTYIAKTEIKTIIGEKQLDNKFTVTIYLKGQANPTSISSSFIDEETALPYLTTLIEAMNT